MRGDAFGRRAGRACQFGQRFAIEQGGGQRVQRVDVAMTHGKACRAPQIDTCNRTRRNQPGNETGPGERGFARAAGTQQKQEGSLARRSVREPFTAAFDLGVATEEDIGMIGLERQQAAERRAALLDAPLHRASQHALGLEPLRQQFLDLALELIGRPEAVEGGAEVAGGAHEPFLPEGTQPLHLRLEGFRLGFVAGVERGLAFLEDVDVGQWPGARRLERGQHLVGSAAGIGPPIGQLVGEVRRKFGAEARPEDRHHDVAGHGLLDLILEGAARPVEVLLPADRAKVNASAHPTVQPVDHALQALALGHDVTRRRNEDLHLAATTAAGIHVVPNAHGIPGPPASF